MLHVGLPEEDEDQQVSVEFAATGWQFALDLDIAVSYMILNRVQVVHMQHLIAQLM